MHWEDFLTAIYESLDGIDYKTAKKIHKAIYPGAKVRAKRDNHVEVTFPEEKK